jgi:lipoyl(octanoyl) transferase
MLDIVYFPDLSPYHAIWQSMREYTEQRNNDSPDQIWVVEHAPVYTLGRAGKAEHVLNSQDIPVVKIDRGGQVTYHGQGQLVVYLLIDLKRHGLFVKNFVHNIEQALIDCLAEYNIHAQRRDKAPGVYVNARKIAALGLRIRKHCSYHGLSLNVDMDLKPFSGINPCGYAGLEVTQMVDEGVQGVTIHSVFERLLPHLKEQLRLV